ncbi:hypothetical protein Hanom_Chr03g00207181 [Helianthus anomalus]
MLFEDEDDFQPFALLDLGDDLPIDYGFTDEDPFDIPAPVHDHPIIGHPDGEHIVAPILDAFPLVGDGEIDEDEDVVVVPPPEIPVIETAGLQLFATESDDNTAMSTALSPARDPTPPHDPEPAPELALVPFGSA